MLVLRRVCTSSRPSPFMTSVVGDHIGASSPSEADEQVRVLLDDLARERNLVRDLREESEQLRSSLKAMSDKDEELRKASLYSESLQQDMDAYKRKLVDAEQKLNESRIQFRDFKEAVEIEKKKLKQGQALPIILSGIVGVLATYAAVRSKMELDNQKFKFLKFELETLWMGRVREIDDRLQKEIDENDRLVQRVKELKRGKDNGYLTILGKRLI